MTSPSDQHRSASFDMILGIVDARIKAASPTIVLHLDEMSVENLRQSAERETWSLFLHGIRHLKDGAPGNQPGSMAEALTKTSLRSSTFAAALGIKPPQFEQILLPVDFSTEREAALFFCLKLIEAAESDIAKSKQIIHQRLLAEKPEDAVKRQMAFSFNVLAEVYGVSCVALRQELKQL